MTDSSTAATALCLSEQVATDPLYVTYHDTEWGRPVRGEQELFERLCLEGFQVGLSWRTVLHKREAFRAAFAGFDPGKVAAFGTDDVARLLSDQQIIRNRAKIAACIRGAQLVLDLHERGRSLCDLVWSHRPAAHPRPSAPGGRADQTPESDALARELRRLGFRFVGPVNCYATMQACGLVNDHVVGCPVGDAIDAA
jgi:DNA-3-methyladenine glycosylase I